MHKLDQTTKRRRQTLTHTFHSHQISFCALGRESGWAGATATVATGQVGAARTNQQRRRAHTLRKKLLNETEDDEVTSTLSH